MPRLFPLLAGILVLAACGGGKQASPVQSSPGSTSKAATSCGSGRVEKPPRLGAFPFPAGLVVTSRRQAGGATVVDGYLPNRSLAEVHAELRQTLSAAGYTLTHDRAAAHDAGVDFSGHGTRGHLKLRDNVCNGAVSFDVTVR